MDKFTPCARGFPGIWFARKFANPGDPVSDEGTQC
jgi:hypothetical protein